MMLRSLRRFLVTTCIALTLLGSSASAQVRGESSASDNASAAYFAISNTSMGGSPSVLSRALIAKQSGTVVRAHLGITDDGGNISRRLFAFGVDAPVGSSAVGMTFGLADYSCDFSAFAAFGSFTGNCGSMLTGTLSWTVPLRMPGPEAGGHLALGLDTGIGFASGGHIIDITTDFGFGPERITLAGSGLSGSIAFPMGAISRGDGVSAAAHIAPRVGYGRATQEVTVIDSTATTIQSDRRSGVIFLIGGGISLSFDRRGLSFDAGFNKAFVKDTRTTLGVGMSFAPKR